MKLVRVKGETSESEERVKLVRVKRDGKTSESEERG